MPRAALLSLHARVDGVEPSSWDDPSLIQLWGPRYNTYVVAERDFALFSLGRLPDNEKGRRRAEETAARSSTRTSTAARLTDREVAGALGIGNAIRYAATTGTVAIRWEGARAPAIWTVAAAGHRPGRRAAASSPGATSTSSGRRPPQGFARWAGISRRAGAAAFAALEGSLVRGPIAARRRVAAGRRRAGDARRARRATPPRACCRAATPTSCSTGPSGSCSSRPRSSAGTALDLRGSGRERSSSTARSAAPGGAPTRSCGSAPGRSLTPDGARRRRGGGAQPAASRPRARDRGRLGDVTDTNICSIVTHGRRVPRGAVPHGAQPRQGNAVRLVAEPVHRLRPPLHVLLRPRLRAAGRPSRLTIATGARSASSSTSPTSSAPSSPAERGRARR